MYAISIPDAESRYRTAELAVKQARLRNAALYTLPRPTNRTEFVERKRQVEASLDRVLTAIDERTAAKRAWEQAIAEAADIQIAQVA